GVIYPALHYGREALVGIALFLTQLAHSGKKCSELRKSYPEFVISKNRMDLTPGTDVDALLQHVKAKYADHPIIDVDGVRINFDRQWVHLRKSNTEPIIRIYAESGSAADADALAQKIINDIRTFLNK
ncbi:MAG: phosphoglucosamine mutase, partial [Bacteroidales bacterium]|nr:phosphoglucosamine mutase [Bacteroidales bacterium]